MSVAYRLPGSEPVVKTDVEAVWLEPGKEAFADFRDQLPNSRLFSGSQLVYRADVFAGGDERVAISHRKLIGEGNRVLRLDPDPSDRDRAERARFQTAEYNVSRRFAAASAGRPGTTNRLLPAPTKPSTPSCVNQRVGQSRDEQISGLSERCS
jgi:hypothetical protein